MEGYSAQLRLETDETATGALQTPAVPRRQPLNRYDGPLAAGDVSVGAGAAGRSLTTYGMCTCTDHLFATTTIDVDILSELVQGNMIDSELAWWQTC